MSEPKIFLHMDRRLEVYEGFLPGEWVEKVSRAAESSPALDALMFDLALSWRTTAYTASMPSMLIKTVQGTSLGRSRAENSDFNIIQFGENILAKVSRSIPELVDDRGLRSRLMAELAKAADDFRAMRGQVEPHVPMGPIWDEFLGVDVFGMCVWSSQRLSFVAFFNAYESFLVQCVRYALDVPRLRATDDAFKRALREEFSQDISYPCWTHAEVNNFRLLRHALSHAAGRETEDLKKQRHGVTIESGMLQIDAGDNHRLVRRLREGVDALVAVASQHPRFK